MSDQDQQQPAPSADPFAIAQLEPQDSAETSAVEELIEAVVAEVLIEELVEEALIEEALIEEVLIEEVLIEEALIEEALAEGDEEVDPIAEFREQMRLAPGDWYVIHSYAGFENKVKMNLESRINSLSMEDYIFQV
ncbi:MAG: transcription termination/antitermination protein NusG, partial [Actinobacteria bacterium]|nr:transcription termination/antitermination protein NusG [Actinomycetota bacterium]